MINYPQRIKKGLLLALATIVGLTPLSTSMVGFASELPNIDLNITSQVDMISGENTDLYFTDKDGVPLTADFYNDYELTLEILSGDDYFETFDLNIDKDGVYYLLARPAQLSDIDKISHSQTRFKLKCIDKDTQNTLAHGIYVVKPTFIDTALDDTIYVHSDGHIETIIFDDTVTTAMVSIDDTMHITLHPQDETSFFFAFTKQYNDRIDELGDLYDTSFDVYDFIINPEFQSFATVTITSDDPYVYSYDKGILTAVDTDYHDGVHTFTTKEMDCILLSQTSIQFA